MLFIIQLYMIINYSTIKGYLWYGHVEYSSKYQLPDNTVHISPDHGKDTSIDLLFCLSCMFHSAFFPARLVIAN